MYLEVHIRNWTSTRVNKDKCGEEGSCQPLEIEADRFESTIFFFHATVKSNP